MIRPHCVTEKKYLIMYLLRIIIYNTIVKQLENSIAHERMIYIEQKKSSTVPDELAAVMEADSEAKTFFDSLSDGYKRGYCDWVGGAKQAATRQTRAEKALIMLRNKQKTLKT